MKTTENNKLIGEFMYPEMLEKERIEKEGIEIGDHMMQKMDVYMEDHSHSRYHSSWDWLMPVVDKIDFNLDMPNGDYFQISINKHKTSIFRKSKLSVPYLQEEIYSDGNDKLTNTYKAVIEFINWYNKIEKK